MFGEVLLRLGGGGGRKEGREEGRGEWNWSSGGMDRRKDQGGFG